MTEVGERDELFQRARELREGGDLGGAINLLFRLLSRDVSDPDVVCELATTLAHDEQHERAGRLFQHALKIAGDSPYLWLNYGTFLCATGRLDQGIEVLDSQREQFAALVDEARQEGDVAAVQGFSDLHAAATLNLAKAHFETGDTNHALDLSVPFLTDPEHCGRADWVVVECAEARGDDVEELCRRLTAEHRASPLMVWRACGAVATETQDPVAATNLLLGARAFLSDDMLRSIHDDIQQLQQLTAWLGDQLVAAAEERPTAKKALSGLNQLLRAREDRPASPGQEARQLGLKLVPAEADRQASASPRDRKAQTALQFGSDDLPLFHSREPAGEDPWLEAQASLIEMSLESHGAAGATREDLLEEGVFDRGLDQALQRMIDRGEAEEDENEDGEPVYRLSPRD